jgi:hypothetical protein
MKLAPTIIALVLATSPAAAQVATSTSAGTTTSSITGTSTGSSTATTTGVICDEEMTATFCNVSTDPNNAGYGTNAGVAATSAGIITPSPAIPTCSNFPPADELCN